MKPPPFLLPAALAFWGWQTGWLWVGIVLGLVLESARFIRVRWEISHEDFRRLWNLCTVVALAAAVYIFATDNNSGGLNDVLHGGTTGARAMASGAHTAFTWLRWLPLFVFVFVAAQEFSEPGRIPLSAISLLAVRWRPKPKTPAEEWHLNVLYPYFMVCLFSAGIHVNEGTFYFFWGQSVLVAWALWPFRSRRLGPGLWLAAGVLAIGLAYVSAQGISQLAVVAQNYNAQWLARFFRQRADPAQSITAIGQIGELKLSSAIMLRLKTRNDAAPPTYLREASYYAFHIQTWTAGNPKNEFDSLGPETKGGSDWDLLPGQNGTNLATVDIACYLNGRSGEAGSPAGLLPLPSGARRVGNLPEASVISIQKNPWGAVLLTGPGFVDFTAGYAPGATLDSPPNTNWDLNVPTNELPALDQIKAELKVAGADEPHKLLAVQKFFAAGFTYRTWQTQDKSAPANETALARFLLRTHSGHCEYFATATVLLLRELGVRARYAVGYYVHEGNGSSYVVREHDAHAWCLVWDEAARTWRDFDTTPGSWVATETRTGSFFQRISDFFSWLHFQFSAFRWGQANYRQYILWALAPVILLLLYQIIFRRRRRTRDGTAGAGRAPAHWPGLDSAFYRLERQLSARGFPRPPDEAFDDWLERVLAAPAWQPLAAPVREILRLHYRYRFDPCGLTAAEIKLLAQKAEALSQALPPN